MFPSSFDIRPLDFGDHCHRSSDSSSSCLMMVAGLVVLYLLLNNAQQSNQMMHGFPGATMGMLSHVSARFAQSTLPSAKSVYPACSSTSAKLVDVPPGSSAATDEHKKSNGKAVTSWMDAHPSSLIMFFAPWCQHCHAAMKTLGDLSCPVLMVNAEAIPEDMVSGSNAMHTLTHFPTFLAHVHGNLIVARSAAEAEGTLEKASAGNATADGVSGKVATVVRKTTPPATEFQKHLDTLF